MRARLSVLAVDLVVLSYVSYLLVNEISRDPTSWLAVAGLVFAALLPALFAVIIVLDLVEGTD